MIEKTAIVTDVSSSNVTFLIEITSSCGGCSANCGNQNIARAFSKKTQEFTVHSSNNFKIGDLIKVGILEDSLLKVAALVYLVPLVFLLLSGVIAQILWQKEPLTILASAIGAFVGYLIAKYNASTFDLEPVIISKLGEELPLL